MDPLLLSLVLLPLLGALYFAFYPAKPKALPALAVCFTYLYAAVSAAEALLALGSESGRSWSAGIQRIGVSGFEIEPRFYLDGRNALFVLLLGLCLPVVF